MSNYIGLIGSTSNSCSPKAGGRHSWLIIFHSPLIDSRLHFQSTHSSLCCSTHDFNPPTSHLTELRTVAIFLSLHLKFPLFFVLKESFICLHPESAHLHEDSSPSAKPLPFSISLPFCGFHSTDKGSAHLPPPSWSHSIHKTLFFLHRLFLSKKEICLLWFPCTSPPTF